MKYRPTPPFVFVIAALLLGTLFGARATAAQVTVSWTHPVQFTDGSPLALVQIAHTRVEWGTCLSGGVFGTKLAEAIINAPQANMVSTVAPGTFCFRAFTKATSAAGGGESVASNVAQKIVPWPDPNPPVITTVLIGVSELRYNSAGTPRLARSLGTAPKGTECTGDVLFQRSTKRYYEIPLSAVKLKAGISPSSITGTIVAVCA